jgi:hypothetical protein
LPPLPIIASPSNPHRSPSRFSSEINLVLLTLCELFVSAQFIRKQSRRYREAGPNLPAAEPREMNAESPAPDAPLVRRRNGFMARQWTAAPLNPIPQTAFLVARRHAHKSDAAAHLSVREPAQIKKKRTLIRRGTETAVDL